jgi:hypothetical protein
VNVVQTFGAALAVFHKIAAHASGLNHVKNTTKTKRRQISTYGYAIKTFYINYIRKYIYP